MMKLETIINTLDKLKTKYLYNSVLLYLIATSFAIATGPSTMLPINNAVVNDPPDFSWETTDCSDYYLNVSSYPDISVINIINWKDDGSHYYSGEYERFKPYEGQTLYWRVACPEGNSEIRSFTVGSTSLDPYYNVLHMLWPYNQYWQPTDISSMRLSELLDRKAQVGSSGSLNNRKLAFSVHIPYFYDADINIFKNQIIKLCQLSEQSDMAIIFGLDGFEWWEGRPDLWNWYDPETPGYDDQNRNNVEWSDWSNQSAVQEGWRNWGSAFKMGTPHPNLASPVVISESRKAIAALVPLIRDWYISLPENKKYLFAGVKVGWEISIGVNYYYPLNGDGTTDDIFTSHQLGYAAVSSLGLATSGRLTINQLNAVLSNYLNKLCKTIVDLGIPRRKIFTHIGAFNSSGNVIFASEVGAFCENANPGWSFYTGTAGPSGLPNLDTQLTTKANGTWWSCAEWGGSTTNSTQILRDFENYHNNKFINSFVDGSEALYATVINTPPQMNGDFHWMHPPVIRSSVSHDTVLLSWSIPSQSQEAYMNISSSSSTDVAGNFKIVNVANERVTGKYADTLADLPLGKYYWQIMTEGNGRTVSSDIDSFEVSSVTHTQHINVNPLTIFPNPTTQSVTISIDQTNTIHNIDIINIIGEIVYSKQFIVTREYEQLDVSDLQNGIYFLRVLTDHDRFIKKIVKF